MKKEIENYDGITILINSCGNLKDKKSDCSFFVKKCEIQNTKYIMIGKDLKVLLSFIKIITFNHRT